MLRRSVLICAALLAAVLVACAGVVVTSVPIRGTSMEPTLHDGDRVMRNPLGSTPSVERFDVVLARFAANGADVVKRVIGLPGDRVEIVKPGARPGVVRVQPGGSGPWFEVANPAWAERWGTLAANCCSAAGKTSNTATPQVVPDGMLFLLGDNFERSDDSRAHGWAPESQVHETVTWRVYPLSAVGRVDDDIELVPAP